PCDRPRRGGGVHRSPRGAGPRGARGRPHAPPGGWVVVSGDPAAGGAAPGRPGVAAFDFDGTLTRRDTLLPFLRRACGGHRVARAVAAAARRTRDRDVLKVAAIDQLFRGSPAERLERLGA